MSALNKFRKNKMSIDKLTNELSKSSGTKKSYIDERFWKPTTDKSGNGFATIRFLPVEREGDIPWRQVFSHGFQGPGGWYLENCPTTINGKCPLCKENTKLWDTGDTASRNIARDRKRRLHYISYIYVVSDPSNPDNDGKVFLYKYGKKIYEKIHNLMIPEFPDEVPRNPFDFDDGCNFKLKIRKVDGYINYDKSEFGSTTPFSDDDDFTLTIAEQIKFLDEFTDPDTAFKSYDDLATRLYKVLGFEDQSMETEFKKVDEPVLITEPAPSMPISGEVHATTEKGVVRDSKDDREVLTETDEDDEDISYFNKLANTEW